MQAPQSRTLIQKLLHFYNKTVITFYLNEIVFLCFFLSVEVHEEKKKNLIQQANNAKDKKDTK